MCVYVCVCLHACMHVCLREHAQVRLDGDDFVENKFGKNSKHSNKWLAVVEITKSFLLCHTTLYTLSCIDWTVCDAK